MDMSYSFSMDIVDMVSLVCPCFAPMVSQYFVDADKKIDFGRGIVTD